MTSASTYAPLFNQSLIDVSPFLCLCYSGRWAQGRTEESRSSNTQEDTHFWMTKVCFSEHTPFLFDLSLKDIQASAQTLITLVKVPDCPCVPANIREFSQIGTAGCMCYLYGVTADKVKQLSQGHSNTVNESLFHSYIEDRQIKICVYAWFGNGRNSFFNNVKLSSLITLN